MWPQTTQQCTPSDLNFYGFVLFKRLSQIQKELLFTHRHLLSYAHDLIRVPMYKGNILKVLEDEIMVVHVTDLYFSVKTSMVDCLGIDCFAVLYVIKIMPNAVLHHPAFCLLKVRWSWVCVGLCQSYQHMTQGAIYLILWTLRGALCKQTEGTSSRESSRDGGGLSLQGRYSWYSMFKCLIVWGIESCGLNK